MPERIQRRRTKGWRMSEGAVYVGRPTRWGNPFDWRTLKVPMRYDAEGEPIGPSSDAEDRRFAVALFKAALVYGPDVQAWPSVYGPAVRTWPDGYPSVDDVRRDLAGKDLVCWCPPGLACHADVLLEVANQKETP